MLIPTKNKYNLNKIIYLIVLISILLKEYNNSHLKAKYNVIPINKIINYLIYTVVLIKVQLYKLKIKIN